MTAATARDGDPPADVIIVGAGAAGVAAAIEAGAAGARTILLERAEWAGGTAALSAGGCLLVDTPMQRDRGIADSVDLAFADWMRAGGGEADDAWARYYLERCRDDVHDWVESLGGGWELVKQLPLNSVPRWHGARGGGAGLMAVLLRAVARTANVEIRTSIDVLGLVVEEGRVAGVDTVDGILRGRTVIVATGGFASNHAMVAERFPGLVASGLLTGSGPGATGDGHRMVDAAGGALTHMDRVWFYVYATPDFRDPAGHRGLVFRVTPAYIWVNHAGRRFHDETQAGGALATAALLAQQPPAAWAILDAATASEMQVEDLMSGPTTGDGLALARRLLAESPFVRRARTLEGLAREISVDVGVFLDEVGRYHEALDAGLLVEPDFGRSLQRAKRFDQPPFYAIPLRPLARKTLGGVRTDLRCRVRRSDGSIIPGLFAAGEVAGMAGGHINGSATLEGTMLGPSLFSGRVAGAWAAGGSGHGRGTPTSSNLLTNP